MTEEKPVCPECGSTKHYRYGYSAQKKQRYKCTDCGRSFILPKDHHIPTWSGHACPRCKSLKTNWAGWTLLTKRRRRRRLKCKDCGRNFYQPEEAES